MGQDPMRGPARRGLVKPVGREGGQLAPFGGLDMREGSRREAVGEPAGVPMPRFGQQRRLSTARRFPKGFLIVFLLFIREFLF